MLDELKEIDEDKENQRKADAMEAKAAEKKLKEKDGEIAAAQTALESAQREINELKSKKTSTEMPPPPLPARGKERGKTSKKGAKEEKQGEK